MRTLHRNETIYLNDKEYLSFKKNIECRELSSKRTTELKTVSERFKRAADEHGKAKLKTPIRGF